MIGDGYKTYADSTLKGMSKYELISIIRTLEHNLREANETNERQYKRLSKVNDALHGEVE